jgi:acyl carrier protein
MTREEIEKKVLHILYEQICIHPDYIKPDTVIVYKVEDNNIYASQHDIMMILLSLEVVFNIKISDADFLQLRTFSDIINYIVKAQEESCKSSL